MVKNFQEYFVIDTKTLSNGYKGITNFKYLKMDNNEEYADLLKLEKERKLSEKFATRTDMNMECRRKACYHQTDEMYNDPACVVAESMEEGLIPIKDEETLTYILGILQKIDKDIKVSSLGKQPKKK